LEFASKKQILILLGGILIALLFYPVVTHLLFYYQKSTLTTRSLQYTIIVLEVVCLYYYSLKAEGQSFLMWEEKQYKLLFYVLGVLALLALQLPGNFLSRIPKLMSWYEWRDKPWSMHYLRYMYSWYQLNLAIIIACTVAWSVCVVLIFRGYLLPRLAILFRNNIAAIILSSLLYALFPFFGFSYKWLIMDFFSSLFFSICYLKYRNIKILIIVRVLLDLTTLYALRSTAMWMLGLPKH
jgi:membrane protease YdiL (CAAX protease family)